MLLKVFSKQMKMREYHLHIYYIFKYFTILFYLLINLNLL